MIYNKRAFNDAIYFKKAVFKSNNNRKNVKKTSNKNRDTPDID